MTRDGLADALRTAAPPKSTEETTAIHQRFLPLQGSWKLEIVTDIWTQSCLVSSSYLNPKANRSASFNMNPKADRPSCETSDLRLSPGDDPLQRVTEDLRTIRQRESWDRLSVLILDLDTDAPRSRG